ncbi:acyltransferase [Agaricicola taiwanensis]|uniref:Acyltransferase n=1 Tax=Agaricicola taiwanensis TaxID=591372 RepID=A0A8J2VP92_9RHOB|nr:acyltransferase [Agaricicola taiwanensis]
MIVFFVLSGFVLMLPFARGRHQTYGIYALRRLTRIYIPFACSILLAAMLYKLSSPGEIEALTAWFNEASWDTAPQPIILLKHLAMTGRWEDMRLNPVMWSLVHELRISLVFPLIAALALRSQTAALTVACAFYVIGFHGALIVEGNITTSLLDTLRFSAFFIIGAIMALRLPALVAWASGLSRIGFAASLGGAMCLFSLKPGFMTEMLFAGAAVGVIALAAGASPARNLLNCAPLRWLGRVSYTLYLVHMPVMLAIFHLADGHLGLAPTTAIAAASVLLASELFYRLFEKPSHLLARAFSGTKTANPALQSAPEPARDL